ncbi:MAG: AAA family ATPase [Candidatus Hermodarchaeota archaeon]
MRIAICGPDGSGKTEIAKYISSKYNYQIVEDYYRLMTIDLGYQTFFEVSNKWKLINNILDKLGSFINEKNNLVFDRSAIDIWVIWQRWCWGKFSPEKSINILEKVKMIMSSYESVVILPINPNPIYDGFRYINKHYAIQYYMLIKGFIANFPNICIYNVIKEQLDLDGIKEKVDLFLKI